MKKRILGLFLAATMSLGLLAGCGSTDSKKSTESSTSATATEGSEEAGIKNINMAVAFWYELDAHKDYNGWYPSMYGITETLFKVNDSGELEGWIADSASSDGTVWTITLNDNVTFSNGDPVNSEVVIKNLQRAGEVNERAAVLASSTYDVIDDKTFTITTTEIYPSLLDDLADPYASIMDIDNITDYNNDIIGTGPFTLVSYSAEDEIKLAANENYWNGDVVLDTATVFFIPDSSTEAMSLQSGEIDFYINPDVDSVALFSSDSNYIVASAAKSQVRYMIFNMETMTDINIRKAIIESIDKDNICTMLGGTDDTTEGAYAANSPYGDVTGIAYNLDDAASLLEKAGYIKNADGLYEKDGEVLTVNIAYYAKKSTDKITTLIQDQLKNAGITAELTIYEEPESTYMTTGDFDIAMYMYSTSAGADSYAFLNATLSSTGNKNAGKYVNADVDSMLESMATEADTDTRVELTKEIQQMVIDDAAVDYYAIPNKVTCMKATVSNVGESSLKDYYMLNKDSSVE